MATTLTRVYIAALAGTAIYDPNGDRVGRVSDVVAHARDHPSGSQLRPRVVGIVAELHAFRRIFIPMGRVTSIDPGRVVLSTGTLNLRKFSSRPGETMVIGELLDRVITVDISEGPAVQAETVDIAMELDRDEYWYLCRVAARQRASRFARRAQLRELDWKDVSGLLERDDDAQGAASLLSATENLRPADLANMMQDLPIHRRRALTEALDDDRLADVVEELPEAHQMELVRSLSQERAADVLTEMDPDDAADVLNNLGSSEKRTLLELMGPEDAGPVQRLLRYAPGIAGAIMTSEPIILPPDATVAHALASIRHAPEPPAIAAQVFVTRSPTATPTGPYLGVAHFQRLLREPPSALLATCIDTDIDPIDPHLSLADVTRRLATYDLVALAVVSSGRLIGAVTVDDVLDHLLPSDWRGSHHA